jgi:hypothetical protein
MAQFTVKIPSATPEEIERIELLARRFRYPDLVPNPDFDEMLPIDENNEATIPNPLTKMQWIKQRCMMFLKQQLREQRADEASLLSKDELNNMS